MANASILKRRIKTAQNVSKTTKAMQMIAASKLRSAQNAAIESRIYSKTLTETIQNLAKRIKPENKPLYMQETNGNDKSLLIILSPDKGLCGGLITNLIKATNEEIDKSYFIAVGKKMENYIVRLNKGLIASFPIGTTLPSMSLAYPITQIIDEYFLNKKVGRVKILFTYFSSIFLQEPKFLDILPIKPSIQAEDKISDTVLFEPDLSSVLNFLLKRYMENIIYQSLLESFLSEQASRMIAMQNATSNAKEIIYDLTLEYNKARQEKITNEILDITSAANVLYE